MHFKKSFQVPPENVISLTVVQCLFMVLFHYSDKITYDKMSIHMSKCIICTLYKRVHTVYDFFRSGFSHSACV